MPEVLRSRAQKPRFTAVELATFVSLSSAGAFLLALGIGYLSFGSKKEVQTQLAELHAKIDERNKDLLAARATADSEHARAEMLWHQNEEAKTGMRSVKAAEDAHANSVARAEAAPNRGEHGVLRSGGELVIVGTDLAVLGEISAAKTANDDTGLKLLLLSGRIMLVPSGTAALVIDSDGMIIRDYKVRIEGSDLAGRAGWVRAEWIHRQ